MIDHDSLLEMFLLGIPVEIIYETKDIGEEFSIHKRANLPGSGASPSLSLFELEKFSNLMANQGQKVQIKDLKSQTSLLVDYVKNIKEKAVTWFGQNLDKKLIEHKSIWKDIEKSDYNIMSMEDYVNTYTEAFSNSPEGKGLKIVISLQYACFLCSQNI